ncbi:MAG TPA: ATP-binding protein [Nevskiaceae bacterium]|nr:ATP-binding protein [Nevskiaceae bacterium]
MESDSSDTRGSGARSRAAEQRTHEEELREHNERLKFALDAARMSFWTLDAGTRAMTVGPDFRRIMALPADAAVDVSLAESHVLKGDRAAVHEAIDAALAHGRSFDLDFRVPNPDGTIRWVNAKGMSVARQDGSTRVIGVVSDVTGRMQAQEEREQLLNREQEARTLAEAATRARDQFLAIVSHELRSPLSGIQSWTHVLESHIGQQASPALRRAIAGVRTGVEQQVRLIDDLLDATRIMSGKLSLLREPVPLLPVVEAAVASVRDQARAKNVEILCDYQVDHEQVMGDRDRLQQIAWNLLSNAVKFTPDGGHVWVRLIRQGDTVRLAVRDDGKGIPEDFQPVMFEWFRRQETTSHRSQDGLGLGLALVRHLCHLHGGNVSASSPGLGHGATFVVTLPVLQRVEHETLGRSVRKPIGTKTAPSLTGLRVLLVDDQGDARESLSFVLREAGAEVVVCASAAEALAALERLGDAKAPSVLISDIAMPLQDGYWLLTQIRERESTAPIPVRLPAIALTAYAQPEDRLRSLTSGFDMHVTKPVAADELITIVATAAGQILRS